jgi:hypothetical protein
MTLQVMLDRRSLVCFLALYLSMHSYLILLWTNPSRKMRIILGLLLMPKGMGRIHPLPQGRPAVAAEYGGRGFLLPNPVKRYSTKAPENGLRERCLAYESCLSKNFFLVFFLEISIPQVILLLKGKAMKPKMRNRINAKKRAKRAKLRANVSKAGDKTIVSTELPLNKQFFADDVAKDVTLPIPSLGGGLKLVKKDTINFTAQAAKDLLDPNVHETFNPDRPLSNAWVNYLLKAMKQGTFRWEQLQIIVCSYKGKLYRMNGQHTSWARINWEDAPKNIPVQILRYSARTENDMRMLYASIDRGKARSKANVINSYLFDSEHFKGYPKGAIKRLSEGLTYWLWGVKGQHTGDEIAFLMQTEYYDIATKVGQFFKNNCQNDQSKHLKRSPVIGAMFETFDKNEHDALRFWEAVRTGANLSVNDARLKLRNHLMTHSINAGRGGGTYMKNVPADDMYHWCVQAWNAFRESRTLRGFSRARLDKRIGAK